MKVFNSNGGGGSETELGVATVANFATAMGCAIDLAAADGEEEPPRAGAEAEGTRPMPPLPPRHGAEGHGVARESSPRTAPVTAAAAAVVSRTAAPPLLSSFSFIPSPLGSSPAPPATALSPALDSASRRVRRLRELLGSVGEAEAWAGLLGTSDGRLSCRRLADLALSAGTGASCAPQAAGYGGAGAVSDPVEFGDRCRLLCSDALGCLAICGRISPGVWVDLSRPGGVDIDGKHELEDGSNSESSDEGSSGRRGSGGGEGEFTGSELQGGDDPASVTRLTRLLSLCLALAGNRDGAAAATGLNEHEYFFGKGSGGAEEQGPEPLSVMALTLVYEMLTGEDFQMKNSYCNTR